MPKRSRNESSTSSEDEDVTKSPKHRKRKSDRTKHKVRYAEGRSSGDESKSSGRSSRSNVKSRNKRSKRKSESQSKSGASGKKIMLKRFHDTNTRDKATDRNLECSTSKSKKSKSRSKSSHKKQKQKFEDVTKSSSDDATDVEDEYLPLSEDLPNYFDKFGILETKVNRLARSVTDTNIQYLVIEEVCLEGLDGITLEALWSRISVRTEQPLPFSDDMMRYFWYVITTRNDIEFYALQEPREKLVFFDRFVNQDPILGACIDPVEAPLDIYPHCPVKDEGIYGSAASYATRKNITDEVRKLTLQEVESIYGMQLVMVGTQKLRLKVLTTSKLDPNLEIPYQEFLLLERIARSRKVGEITQGKVSLYALNKDSKTLYYNRKALLENELITKQQFFLITSDAHNCSCTLLHLARFYNIRKTKSQIMTEQIVEVLRKRPFHRMDCANARRIFGHRKSLKKLFKFHEFLKVVKIDTCYRFIDLYPNATARELRHKGADGGKFIRTIELINPSLNNDRSLNEDETKDDSSDEDIPKQIIFNRPLLYQIYMVVHDSGKDGLTLKEIIRSVGFDYYSIRSAIKALQSSKYILGVKIDMGRQRVTRYRSNYEDTTNIEIEEEDEQESLDFVSNILGITDSSLLSKPKEPSKPTTSINNAGNYQLIKQLRKQNNPENIKTLERIFKNQHEYSTAKNSVKFYSFAKIKIFSDLDVANNKATDNKPSHNFRKVSRQIKALNKQPPLEIQGNLPCPLYLEESQQTYRKLCYFVTKLVHPILVLMEYEIVTLEPRRRYQCKLQLPKEKLQEFSEQKLDNIINDEQAKQPDSNYPYSNKSIKYQIYMGPKPEMIYHANNDNNVEVTVMASTKPHEFGETSSNYVKDNNATLRTLKRTKFVIDMVQQEKIVTDVFNITKLLTNLDNEEGYKVKIDKKTINRIYMRLVKSGLIKILRVSLQFAGAVRNTTVLCDASYDLQYSVIESLIEQLKLKAFSCANVRVGKEDDQFNTKQISSSVGELNLLARNSLRPPYIFKKHIGRDYGNAPKFMRMRILHEFMFYLLYEYPNDVKPVASKENNEKPHVYSRENNWKMFVPPLPKHKGWPEGWTIICDLLLRIPLSLFVKICNVSFVIPELKELLEDNIKQHTLIKYLPPDMRNALLYRRKYIYSIHETLAKLCFIGLVQFGPQKLRDKDQVFVYLNRRASLWDTTTSEPGYHYVQEREYKHLKYNFKNGDIVDNYWYEMWNICMHTKLGLRQTVTGTYITIEQLDRKPAMIESMKPQTHETAVQNDDGRVPGDKRGAAGFDSALWSHVKRNWMWNEKVAKPQKRDVNTKKRKGSKSIPEEEIKKETRKKHIRKVLPRKDQKNGRKADYDAVDRKLMLTLQQSRPGWLESEDKVLHICKVVIMFLHRMVPRQFIQYTVIRDVLHKLSPFSRNKTSGSVRRRLFNIFGLPEKQELFLRIAKALDCIPFVKKYFHTIHPNDTHANGAFAFLTTYFFNHQSEMQRIFNVLLSNTTTHDIPISTEVLKITSEDPVEKPNRAFYSKLPQNHPQIENDIITDTIQSIIHSSLGSQQTETSWLIQLCCVYRKYPQEILRKALNDLRANHLTSGRRSAIRKAKNIEGLPIITKFFQFSHYYCYMHITKYPQELFIEAHEIFMGIWKNNNAKYIPMEGFKQGHTVGLAELAVYVNTYYNVDIPQEVLVLNPNITDHTELIRELAVRYKKMLSLIKVGTYFNDTDQIANDKVKYGYRWPMIHRFLRSWFLSDYTEEVDSDDADVTTETVISRTSTIISQEDGKRLIGNLNPIRGSTNTDTTFEDYEKKLESFLSSSNDSENADNTIIVDSTNVEPVEDAGILQTFLSSLKPQVTRPSEKVNENVTEVPEKEDARIQYLMNDQLSVEQIMEEMLSDCPLEERKVPKPTNLARLLVLGLFPDLDEDEERLERLYKHFLVICPEVKFLLPVDFETNKTLNYLCEQHSATCKKLLKKVQKDAIITTSEPSLDELLAKLKSLGGNDYDLHIAEKLLHYIHMRKSIGASIQQLKENYIQNGNFNLVQTLKALTETNFLIRAGVVYFVYVHYEFRKPWIVESCTLANEDRQKLLESDPETLGNDLHSLSSLGSYEEVKLQIRPWTLIDGSLNTELFKKWLYTILAHCLSNAMLPLCNLLNLCPFLKPVDIYYLLECLIYLGCVRLFVYKVPTSTLLSTHVFSKRVKADETDNFEDIYIECDTLGLIRLGALLNVKQQAYDFTVDAPSRYESF